MGRQVATLSSPRLISTARFPDARQSCRSPHPVSACRSCDTDACQFGLVWSAVHYGFIPLVPYPLTANVDSAPVTAMPPSHLSAQGGPQHPSSSAVASSRPRHSFVQQPNSVYVHQIQDSNPSGSPPLQGDIPVSPTGEVGNSNRRPGKRPAARGTAFYPRKRANTACQVCRARKTKCDNKKPSCSYCLSVGATCIQSPVDLSSFDPASLKILDRLDDLEKLLRDGTSAAVADLPAIASPNLFRGSISGEAPNSYRSDKHSYPQQSPADDRQPSSHSHQRAHDLDHIINDDGPEVNSVLPLRVDYILQWPLFNDEGTPEPLCGLPPDAISTPAAGSAALAGLVDMESHRLYRLLDNFFLYIHCKNPILDESSTRRMVGNAFLNGIDWSPASCLAMVICALGCLATPFGASHGTKPGTQLYLDSQVFFHAAQKRIGILLVSSDIVGAQCLFLSGVYMMMVFQPIYAWRFFSQALAACQHFPFLRRAQHKSSESTFSPDSMEMGRQDTQEQAVYWSAWKSERELRHELSLPDFDIKHSGSTLYPPFFPAPPVPPADSPEGPDTETQRARAAWLFYLAEISLRRLTSRLCSEVTELRRQQPSTSKFLILLGDMINEYEGQAREWSENLPAELSIQNPVEEDGISRSVLRGKLINLYEMFYWPFVMATLSAVEEGIPVSATISSLANKGLEMHVHQVRVNEPGFYHRHHGGLFMIRACTRSALVLAAAAKSGISMPANWKQSVYNVTGMLSYWEDEDRNLIQWRTTLEREVANIIDE